jgi:hypothetical protein
MDMDEIAKEAEAVNAAEEWLIKARRVRRLIDQRVREAIRSAGTPVVRALGVEREAATGQEPPAAPSQPASSRTRMSSATRRPSSWPRGFGRGRSPERPAAREPEFNSY